MTKPIGWVRPPLPEFRELAFSDMQIQSIVARLERLKPECVSDEDCWPARNFKSYATVLVDGVSHQAHRLACHIFNGPFPRTHHIAHSCDNPPCINPRHLSAVLPAENCRQAFERGLNSGPRGEKCGTAKLTEADVLAAIDECRITGHGYRRIAARLGLPPSAVKDVLSGRSWQHITGGKPVAKVDHFNAREAVAARCEVAS